MGLKATVLRVWVWGIQVCRDARSLSCQPDPTVSPRRVRDSFAFTDISFPARRCLLSLWNPDNRILSLILSVEGPLWLSARSA
jgi:hypothetical protein